jgi:hypothetical protein
MDRLTTMQRFHELKLEEEPRDSDDHRARRRCGTVASRKDRTMTGEQCDMCDEPATGMFRRLATDELISVCDEHTGVPRWTAENRPIVDTAKPAILWRAIETVEFYFAMSSVRKSGCTFVRQLRGPHLRTCA